jgi:aldose 1-epimerase
MTKITKQDWGTTSSGEAVLLYTLSNSKGTTVTITDFGGRIVTLKTADRNGNIQDVVLGLDNLESYEKKNPFLGALVGRFANRIANGTFTLEQRTYKLAQNNGSNALHGGLRGFDIAVWRSREISVQNEPALELTYVSKDGEEGYPGTLTVVVVYTLSENNELKIDYSATTDKTTVLNLTNHSYFDLSGNLTGQILDHVVTINADHFTPVNANLIPTGELRNVGSTPFDFRTPKPIGAEIDNDYEQLKIAHGYDHNFVLAGAGQGIRLAARVSEPKSGRVMEVLTTQPGVQFYSGNHLDGSAKGKGRVYGFRSGFCFETQHFPDSPNQPNFPSTALRPGERFHEQTVFKFSGES